VDQGLSTSPNFGAAQLLVYFFILNRNAQKVNNEFNIIHILK
jgi:hypothetical protein